MVRFFKICAILILLLGLTASIGGPEYPGLKWGEFGNLELKYFSFLKYQGPETLKSTARTVNRYEKLRHKPLNWKIPETKIGDLKFPFLEKYPRVLSMDGLLVRPGKYAHKDIILFGILRELHDGGFYIEDPKHLFGAYAKTYLVFHFFGPSIQGIKVSLPFGSGKGCLDKPVFVRGFLMTGFFPDLPTFISDLPIQKYPSFYLVKDISEDPGPVLESFKKDHTYSINSDIEFFGVDEGGEFVVLPTEKIVEGETTFEETSENSSSSCLYQI